MSTDLDDDGGNTYLDPLDAFTDREEILTLFQQVLRAAQPGRLHLLAVKGNSGTGKTFLVSYLAQHICPRFGYQVGQLRFAQSTPDFRSILEGIEYILKGCVPRESFERYRTKRDEYNRRFDNYRTSITIHQEIEADHHSSIFHVNQNVHVNSQLYEREMQLRSELRRALIELSEESTQPLCLFIDGYEHLVETVPELIDWLWEEVLPGLVHAIPQPLLIMTCGWEWPSNAAIEPFMQRVELSDFNLAEVRAFLAKLGIIPSPSDVTTAVHEELIAACYELTLGHPLVLGLAASYFNELDSHERTANTLRRNVQFIDDKVRVEFLEKRLLERLPEPYRTCLERGPILRSFDQAALQALLSTPVWGSATEAIVLDDRTYARFLGFPFISQEAISSRSTSMLRPTFHELVKRVRLGVLRQHHPATKEQLHRKMVDYYKTLTDELQEPQRKFEARLEYLYHALQVEEYQARAFDEWNWLIVEAIDKWQRQRASSLLDIIRQLEREGEPSLGKTSVFYGRYLIWHSKFFLQEVSWKEALASLEQALQVFEQVDNPTYVAASLNNIGVLLREQGDLEQSLRHHERALNLRRKDGRPEFIAQSLNNIGLIYHAQGKLEQALQYYEQASFLFEQAGIPTEIATTLSNMGRIYDFKGELEQALSYYKQSLDYDEQAGNPTKTAGSLNNIGGVYRQLGDLEQALQYHERALTLNERIGNSIGIASAADSIGRVYESMEKFEQALRYYERALALPEGVGNSSSTADSLDNIGGIYRRQGKLEQSLSYHERALALRERVGDPIYIATSFNNIGAVYHAQGEMGKALQFFERALALLEGVEYPAGLAACLDNIGRIYHELGQLEQALSHHKRALSFREQIGNLAEQASTFNNIGFIYFLQKKFELALSYYERALSIREQLGHPAPIALSHNNGFETDVADQLEELGVCYAQLGENEKSSAYKSRAQQIRKAIKPL